MYRDQIRAIKEAESLRKRLENEARQLQKNLERQRRESEKRAAQLEKQKEYEARQRAKQQEYAARQLAKELAKQEREREKEARRLREEKEAEEEAKEFAKNPAAKKRIKWGHLSSVYTMNDDTFTFNATDKYGNTVQAGTVTNNPPIIFIQTESSLSLYRGSSDFNASANGPILDQRIITENDPRMIFSARSNPENNMIEVLRDGKLMIYRGKIISLVEGHLAIDGILVAENDNRLVLNPVNSDQVILLRLNRKLSGDVVAEKVEAKDEQMTAEPATNPAVAKPMVVEATSDVVIDIKTDKDDDVNSCRPS